MIFWGHRFRQFGEVERICMTCGYVIPAPTEESAVKAWIISEKGCEIHCGGAWHRFKRIPALTSA